MNKPKRREFHEVSVRFPCPDDVPLEVEQAMTVELIHLWIKLCTERCGWSLEYVPGSIQTIVGE